MGSSRTTFVAALVTAVCLCLAGVAAVARADEDDNAPRLPPPKHAPPGMRPLQSLSGGPPPTVVVQWTSVYGGGSGVPKPPDPHGAVGPDGILEVSNQSLSYLRRDGTVVWNGWNLYAAASIDKQALYEPLSERFIVVGSDYSHCSTSGGGCATLYIQLAVSKSSNPDSSRATGWYLYQFPVTETIGSEM